MYICVCMYVYTYICMYYVWTYVCIYVCMYILYVCIYVCMYVWIYVCIYVCTYICMYVCFRKNTQKTLKKLELITDVKYWEHRNRITWCIWISTNPKSEASAKVLYVQRFSSCLVGRYRPKFLSVSQLLRIIMTTLSAELTARNAAGLRPHSQLAASSCTKRLSFLLFPDGRQSRAGANLGLGTIGSCLGR